MLALCVFVRVSSPELLEWCMRCLVQGLHTVLRIKLTEMFRVSYQKRPYTKFGTGNNKPFLTRSENCGKPLLDSCLSFRVEQLGCHWTDFHEIWYWTIFKNLSRKFSFYWSLASITAALGEDQYTFFYLISLNSSQNEKCFGQTL